MNLLCSVFRRDLHVGLVDPDLVGERGDGGTSMREALWMGEECGVEDDSAV